MRSASFFSIITLTSKRRWSAAYYRPPILLNVYPAYWTVPENTRSLPQWCSALIYWGDFPSRIYLGEDKYGGRFTVEEVEDAKTVLWLIPVVLFSATCGLGFSGTTVSRYFNDDVSNYTLPMQLGFICLFLCTLHWWHSYSSVLHLPFPVESHS